MFEKRCTGWCSGARTNLSRSSVNIHDFWRTASSSTKLQLLSSLSISSIALAFRIFGLMPLRSNDSTMVTNPPRTAAINADSLPIPHCWFKSIGQMYAWICGCVTLVPSKRHRSNFSISPSFPDKHAIYNGVWPKLSSIFGSNAHSYSQPSMLCENIFNGLVFRVRTTLPEKRNEYSPIFLQQFTSEWIPQQKVGNVISPINACRVQWWPVFGS